ncbi:hypothetical protein MJO28_006146 [Puccinia striiformis f. sp. tritici]|uniref:Uncharacterized protein n=1 Tax=Puccinia striiformis f. sp. tritici TaxID=168172 RepID=A0ACC0EHD2_9BASI|nr:hypothetical protein MJO28_006146 [Puccinia striiformis f. sp. tritici]
MSIMNSFQRGFTTLVLIVLIVISLQSNHAAAGEVGCDLHFWADEGPNPRICEYKYVLTTRLLCGRSNYPSCLQSFQLVFPSATPTKTTSASPTPALCMLSEEGNHGKSCSLAPATGAATPQGKPRMSNNIFADSPALVSLFHTWPCGRSQNSCSPVAFFTGVQDKDGNWWECNYMKDGDHNNGAVCESLSAPPPDPESEFTN